MKRQMQFTIQDPFRAIKLLRIISRTPLVGDPYLDDRVDGVAYDDQNRPLYWSIGCAEAEFGWLSYTWDGSKPPNTKLMRRAFGILDEVSAELELCTAEEGESHVWTI